MAIGHLGGWMTVRVAESTHLGLDGHKLVKNMSIGSPMSMEVIIGGKFRDSL